MKRSYRIAPEGGGARPSDAEIARYMDATRLKYNYVRAKELLHRKPIYKDRRAFLVILIIVLLAWLLSEGDRKPRSSNGAQQEQVEASE